jgi:hypothetical protein
MRSLTLSISDETYARVRVWVAERDITIRAIAEVLLQGLPTNPRAIKAFPIPAFDQPRPKSPQKAHATQSFSATSTKKSAEKPSQNIEKSE